MKSILLATGIALSVTAAKAEPDLLTANSMLPHCKAFLTDQAQTFEQGLCSGTIMTLLALAVHHDFSDRVLCADVPAKASVSQVARVVIRYFDQHPAQLHESFLKLAYTAMADAWPCRIN